MSSVSFNPPNVTVTAEHVARDGVTAFRLTLALDNSNPNASADVPVPAPNPDGTYTVPLASLYATLSSAYYGLEYNLGVACVNGSGGASSPAISSTGKVVYQPVPSAPSSVVVP